MTIAIIQARSSSKRFPNKVMMKINKEPLLNYVISRVNKSKKIKKIIIACSNNKSDDAIANYCKKNNYIYFRGSLKNVLNRFVNVCKKFKLNHFVRVNGDSPCIDPKVMDRGIRIFRKKKYDLVTNVFPRSYPKGVSVEVIKSQLIYDLDKKKISNFHKEHVTSYFYDNDKRYKIFNFRNKKNLSKLNLSIDTKKDFKKIQVAIKQKNFLSMSWKKIINTI